MSWEDRTPAEKRQARREAREYACTDDSATYVVTTDKGTRIKVCGRNSARAVAGKDGTYEPETNQPTGGTMTAATTNLLTRWSPAQWRILNALHWRERATKPVIDARGLLRQQDAGSDDLLALSRAGLVEGVVPGHVIDLATINWAVALRRRNYVSCRNTTKGGTAVTGSGVMVILNATGRGHRYQIKDVVASAGLSSSDADTLLRQAEEMGLVAASGDDGQRVPFGIFRRSDIPMSLRLSLTRRGGIYLARKA